MSTDVVIKGTMLRLAMPSDVAVAHGVVPLPEQSGSGAVLDAAGEYPHPVDGCADPAERALNLCLLLRHQKDAIKEPPKRPQKGSSSRSS